MRPGGWGREGVGWGEMDERCGDGLQRAARLAAGATNKYSTSSWQLQPERPPTARLTSNPTRSSRSHLTYEKPSNPTRSSACFAHLRSFAKPPHTTKSRPPDVHSHKLCKMPASSAAASESKPLRPPTKQLRTVTFAPGKVRRSTAIPARGRQPTHHVLSRVHAFFTYPLGAPPAWRSPRRARGRP